MLELIDMVSEEADRAKTRHAPKDHTGNGKTGSQTNEALAATNANSKRCRKDKCHHCKKDGHWERDCFTKKQEEEAAQVQSSQAAQVSTSHSKPKNKPMGSTNIASINDLDGDGFWLIEEEKMHAYIYCAEPDFDMSDLDMESDVDDKASHAKLASAEDEQALDPFGSDNQLVSEGEDRNTEEEANAATLEEEDAPCSEAHPVLHHALHAPIISHTPASSGEPDKEGHTF
jgi:hypothetical protein